MPVHAVGGSFKAVRYEGYGPGGAAIVVDSVTDDRNRTGTEVRDTFLKYGGNLGAQGSVSYLFHIVGLMTFPPGTDEGRLMQVALEAGAEDVVQGADTSIEVLADERLQPIENQTQPLCHQRATDIQTSVGDMHVIRAATFDDTEPGTSRTRVDTQDARSHMRLDGQRCTAPCGRR